MTEVKQKRYYDGEIVSREVDGHTYRVRVNYPFDHDHEEPWNDGDGQGIVSDWERRDKKPGERILCTDRSSKRFFDWQGTIAKAKLEGWDAAPYGGKRGERAHRAVEKNFQWMKDWLNDKWRYVGIVVTLIPEGEDPKDVEISYDYSCWGFEDSDDAYLAEETEGFIEEAIADAVKAREQERLDALAAQERKLRMARIATSVMIELAAHEVSPELQGEFRELCDAAGVDFSA